MAHSSVNNGSPLKYDPDFCGLQKHRSCTDILCLLLFAVFLSVWAAIAGFAFNNGDPKRLLFPVDSYGHRCAEADLVNNTNLFFFDLLSCLNADALWSGCKTPKICVSSCPQEIWIADLYLKTSTKFNSSDIQSHLICTNQTILKSVTDVSKLQDVIDKKACARWYVPSQPVYHHCIPNMKINYTEFAETFKNSYAIDVPFSNELLNKSAQALQALNELNQVAEDVLHDLNATWRHIILLSIAALVITFVYIVLLRFLAGVVIWLSILALIALFSLGAFFSYKNYALLKEHPNGRLVPDSNSLEGQVTKVLNKWELWMVLLAACSIFILIIVFVIVFLRTRIYIATALIEEGSKAVSSTITTLFLPLVPWALQLAVLIWSVGVFVFLYSTGPNTYIIEGLDNTCTCTGPYQNINNNDTCTVEEFNKYCHQKEDPNSHCFTAGCAIYGLSSNNPVFYFHLFNLFGFFWGIWFVTGLSQMILAGAFATWYWTFDKRNVPFFNLANAILRTIWYHLGTVVFGSFIISICSFIRVIIEFAEKKLKKYENPLTKAVFRCCKCFFWCLEKFLYFINSNAYIMCAIHGTNFCTSAKDAFQLLMRNVIRAVFVDKITDLLLFLGKALLTAAVVVFSYQVFTGSVRLLDDSGRDVTLFYPWIPTVIVGIMTYTITSLFFSVYSMAVDTLFLCFLEDCERNDGSVEKPYFMSKKLMKILGKKNKKI